MLPVVTLRIVRDWARRQDDTREAPSWAIPTTCASSPIFVEIKTKFETYDATHMDHHRIKNGDELDALSFTVGHTSSWSTLLSTTPSQKKTDLIFRDSSVGVTTANIISSTLPTTEPKRNSGGISAADSSAELGRSRWI
ncbi:unnamed protein product [Peronospora effusa]|nr:unnamed protein product [Peronospora effusa]